MGWLLRSKSLFWAIDRLSDSFKKLGDGSAVSLQSIWRRHGSAVSLQLIWRRHGSAVSLQSIWRRHGSAVSLQSIWRRETAVPSPPFRRSPELILRIIRLRTVDCFIVGKS